MSLREAAEKAMQALEYSFDSVSQEYLTDWRHGLPSREAQLAEMREAVERHDAAINAIRTALAEAEEPVAARHADRKTTERVYARSTVEIALEAVKKEAR